MRFWVVVILLFFTAVLGFSQEEGSALSDDWYQGKPIREIQFAGLRNVQHSELEALMNPYRGRIFTDAVFWDIQGRLYALEYFDRIEPSTRPANASGDEVIIRFNVTERPVIGRINFIGNSNLRRSELLDVITSGISDIFNQAKVRLDIDAIINKYLEKGFTNVRVTSSETNTGDSSVTLNFHITEGEQISISRIEFQGNTRFTASTLRSQLSLKAKSLLNNGAFQEARLIADRETITRYYHDRGYIDAIVRDVTRTTETTERGSSLVLTFLIDEGSEFRFGGITFSGNSLFSSDQLQRLVSSRTGDIINRAKLEADMQRVADLYYENGYIFNSFSRVEARNTETNTISFAITITERSRAYIESITIVGNQRTNDNVILREIPLEPGDVFSRTKIMEAMRNLYNLQYFSMVIPETLPGSTENLMDLVFTFEEQMTTDLQFGLTFSGVADPDTFPISGLFKWTDRNLAGTGNELGAEINTSVIDTSTFSINYLHRWLLGMPFSLGVDFSANYNNRLALMDNQPPFFYGDEDYAFPDGFTSREEYEDTGIPTRDYLMNYEQWYISTGISSGYRWMTPLGIFGLNGGMRFGIVQNIYKNDLYRPFDPALRAGNNTWMPKNSLWLSLSLDQRDIFYDPSNGYYLYERLGLYGILNNEREHYMRSDTKVQYFLTLFNFQVTESWSFKSVLALHMGVSFLFSQPFRPDALTVEESNKLAVDGMFNARGWRSEYRSRKGFMLFDSWIELRFPIVQNFIALDLFFDAAGVETKQGDYFWGGNFTEENLRFSFGGSLRLALPQFPIRLSLAKRFRIEDGQVLWQAGDLFHDSTRPTSGMDLVFSIVMSY